MPLSAGVRLGPYEILDAIGAGGMGEVYRAKDTRLDRIVAIKILPAHLSSDPLRKQRFEREAKTISSLNHPNICVLHDVGQQDGIDYLVMECVEGETLAKRRDFGLAKPDRKSTRLNSSHITTSYAVFCLKKKDLRLPRRSAHRVDGCAGLPVRRPAGGRPRRLWARCE